MELHLGTFVDIAGSAVDPAIADDVIAAAFREIAVIHELMSFHLPHSDVSRLNRASAGVPVSVDPRSAEVIRKACELSCMSGGCFDITVAADLVRGGCLPHPAGAVEPESGASWRDIEVLDDDAVVFHRPLWVDLGGIAKGFAVDRAFSICAADMPACLVNAGGDMRLAEGLGGDVALDAPGARDAARVELFGGSLASSCSGELEAGRSIVGSGQHRDGVTRRAIPEGRFVTVLAQDCMVADALAKVVLAQGQGATALLERLEATAFVHDTDTGWMQYPIPGTTFAKIQGDAC